MARKLALCSSGMRSIAPVTRPDLQQQSSKASHAAVRAGYGTPCWLLVNHLQQAGRRGVQQEVCRPALLLPLCSCRATACGCCTSPVPHGQHAGIDGDVGHGLALRQEEELQHRRGKGRHPHCVLQSMEQPQR